MSWWLILLCILLALVLLNLIPLGARVRYGAGGLEVAVLAGPAKIRIFPMKEGAGKKKKKTKKTPKKKAPTKQAPRQAGAGKDKPGTVARVMDLLPVVAQAAGALRRKILIRHLKLKVVWAAADPAAAAMGYGRAHALIGLLWPLFAHNFRVREHDFQVEVDYERTQPELSMDLALTITVGQLLAFALHYGIKLLNSWSRSGRSCQQRRGGLTHERTKSSHQ